MATKTPQFQGPDGVYRDRYIFTTDMTSRFFVGKMDADTVDMQIKIRSNGWTSDPDSIYFEGTTFIVPNPSAYPQGLRLLPGANHIEVKAIMSNGEVTAPGIIEANLSLDRDIKAGVLAPSGVFVERFDQRVAITVDGVADNNVVGYNFYASTAPGGGSIGYTQINLHMVISGTPIQVYDNIGNLSVDAPVAVNQDGSQKSTPQYLRVTGVQMDRNANVFQTDFDQLLTIPETTSRMRTTMVVEGIRQTERFSFTHDRRSTESSMDFPAIPNSDFNAIPDTDPLYYVVTAVYLIDNVEYESAFSPEVAAAPLIVTPAIASLPTVARQQIIRDASLSIFRSHPDVDIKPGSVLRDTVIDPFSTEAERVRFIIGFLQAAQAPATLLPIDDPGNTGESIAVDQSQYKLTLRQAFYLKDNQSVQNMIDNMFDHLAARRGTIRKTGTRAQGEVTLYTTSKPNGTLSIPIGTSVSGGNGATFLTTSAAEISSFGGTTFYNPSTGRYYSRAFIQANSTGSNGNLAPGQIRVITGAPNNVQVINDSQTFGGTDTESNQDLAARAEGVLSAVDSGTYRGYSQNAIEVPGIRQVNVVDAGHTLMMRDYDVALGKHTGGKVDVWVRGDNVSTLSDSFAFTFDTVKNGQFEPVGDVANMLFRAINPALTADNPIIEMLVIPTWGIEFTHNGNVMDLTNAVLIAPDRIQLSSTYNDPSHLHLGDVFTGSYRYRTSNRYVFTRQPVTAISSLIGEKTGTVDPDTYKLFHGSDPLDMGRSSEAGDYMKVIQPLDPGTTGVLPSGDPVVITDENHVFLGGTEYLQSLGINPMTVRIWNVDKTVEYIGPFHPLSLGNRDFTFVDETGTTPMGFKATTTARFIDGDTLLISYEHDENFVINYTANSLVSITQNAIDLDRHVTADVLVKDSIPTGVNIKATVVIVKDKSAATIDGAIRTNLARLFGSFGLGQPVRQSDIGAVIDNTKDVSYVVLPLVTMCKSDGSIIVREALVSSELGTDYVQISAWSTNNVKVYFITQRLESGTIGSGGEINDFRGVFKGPVLLTNYDIAPDANGVPIKMTADASYIIGNDGLNIPGYSDDATIIANYVLPSDPDKKASQILTIRKSITSRRILVALKSPETPATGSYTVSYVVYGDSGVKNIEPGPTDYLELGDLEFTYDEDTNFEALVKGRSR